jgi:transmembrane sensor
MPRKSRTHNQADHTPQDDQWQQAWADPSAMEAGKKETLLNNIHDRIGNRRKRQLLYIGIGAAAAMLVAVFIKMPGTNARIQVVNWRQLASNDTTKKVLLEDGSVLWLAPHSVVQVHPDFKQQRSAVLMQGIVFCSVARDALHPFVMTVNHQQVTVLGTAFTIHKLDSTDIELTVKEGKVALDNASGRQLLTVGQRVSTVRATTGTVQTINPAAADWWLQQQVRLHNISLEELLSRVESYYQVKLSYGKINKKMKVALTWDMMVPLKENLSVLNALTGYDIR